MGGQSWERRAAWGACDGQGGDGGEARKEGIQALKCQQGAHSGGPEPGVTVSLRFASWMPYTLQPSPRAAAGRGEAQQLYWFLIT